MERRFFIISTPNDDGQYDVYDQNRQHVTSAMTDTFDQVIPGISASTGISESFIDRACIEYVGNMDELNERLN